MVDFDLEIIDYKGKYQNFYKNHSNKYLYTGFLFAKSK